MCPFIARHNNRCRRGVTIVEVLVVIAIIGLLLAILLPAINSVRRSAYSRECQNNLRQLGTAIYSYEETFGKLPIDGENGWGYGAYLLLYLDQKPLYDQINPGGEARTPAHKPLVDTSLAVFRCPLFGTDEARLADGAGRSTYPGSTELFSYGATFEDIQEGASNTVLVSETDGDQAWALSNAAPPDGSRHLAGYHLLYADGSARFQKEEQ